MTRPTLIAALTIAIFLAALAAAVPANAEWTWPVQGEVITPFRNGDDPYASGQHRGIDIAGELGAPVVAATGGEVRFAGTAGSSGLTVGIRTEDGRFDTSYLHLSSVAVREGQRVVAGDPVGAVGTTGTRSAERAHLHFGVREAGSRHAYHDPLAFLPPAPVTPERPRGAPSPSPVPAPVGPGPAPAPAPVHRPAGRRAPQPRRSPQPRDTPRAAPAPRRAPEPRRAPSPRRAPTPQGAPAPRAAPAPRTAPSPRRAPTPRGAPTPHGAPAPRVAPRLAPRAAPSPDREHRLGPRAAPAQAAASPDAADRAPGSADAAPRPEPASDRGPDLGWALACFGLLVAAGLLGLSEDGRRATARSSRRLSGFLRLRLGRG